MENPLKTLRDLFENLIVEHGSAVIQERHISFLKTQFAILEKKIIEFEAKIRTLETKIQELETEKQRLQENNAEKDRKIQMLEEQVEEINNISNHRDPGWNSFT